MVKVKPKKCKVCKEEFIPRATTQVVCGYKCALEDNKSKKKKAWDKEKKIRKENLMTREDYFQKALKAFNFFIRERDRELPCISCDKPAGEYRLTSGHFYPQGTHRNLALDEDNAHGQCWYNCNKNKHGNLLEYRPRLIKKIGQERVDALEQRRNGVSKPSIPELKELAAYYNKKGREEINKRKSNSSS
jgi:hypothetical protein